MVPSCFWTSLREGDFGSFCRNLAIINGEEKGWDGASNKLRVTEEKVKKTPDLEDIIQVLMMLEPACFSNV
jgi:hypothetical protein